jgi:hypothetical protein
VIPITSKSPYALRALAELGRTGGDGPIPIGELARRRDIPVQFLEVVHRHGKTFHVYGSGSHRLFIGMPAETPSTGGTKAAS